MEGKIGFLKTVEGSNLFKKNEKKKKFLNIEYFQYLKFFELLPQEMGSISLFKVFKIYFEDKFWL